MYSENAQHLFDLLQTVPTLKSGLAVGGRADDPAMTKIPLPSAWVLLHNDEPEPAGAMNPAGQVVKNIFVVVVYVPYISQADLIATQLPLLESVMKVVRGQQAPMGQKWRYEGQRLTLVNPDKLAYEQRYSVVGFI